MRRTRSALSWTGKSVSFKPEKQKVDVNLTKPVSSHLILEG